MAKINPSVWLAGLAIIMIASGAIAMLRNKAEGTVFIAAGAVFVIIAIAQRKKSGS